MKYVSLTIVVLGIFRKDATHSLFYPSFHKCYNFTFSIVNFPFISNNIPASPVYGAYISQLIRYSRACAQYSDLLDRAQLLTQKLLKQCYVAPSLESFLQIFYGRHHNLVDRYEISISQMTMNL
jgi:predicted O-linked N-acetylglucosamine transferase (SPINDLY family)